MIHVSNTDPQWRNAPVRLTPQEYDDPYIVLEWFFYPGNRFPTCKKRLRKWLVAAIDGKKKWKRNPLVRCIYCFEFMGDLIDALWIINQRADSFTVQDISLRGSVDTQEIWSERTLDEMNCFHYEETAYYPEFLSHEEESDPYSVIRNFFKDKDAFDAKNLLDFWCRTTIANHWNYGVMSRPALVSIFEQMSKLLEAVFIIVEVRLIKAENS